MILGSKPLLVFIVNKRIISLTFPKKNKLNYTQHVAPKLLIGNITLI